jgi:hypothetical protein
MKTEQKQKRKRERKGVEAYPHTLHLLAVFSASPASFCSFKAEPEKEGNHKVNKKKEQGREGGEQTSEFLLKHLLCDGRQVIHAALDVVAMPL